MFSHIFHLLVHLNVCKCKAQTTRKIYFSSARSYHILLINICSFCSRVLPGHTTPKKGSHDVACIEKENGSTK